MRGNLLTKTGLCNRHASNSCWLNYYSSNNEGDIQRQFIDHYVQFWFINWEYIGSKVLFNMFRDSVRGKGCYLDTRVLIFFQVAKSPPFFKSIRWNPRVDNYISDYNAAGALNEIFKFNALRKFSDEINVTARTIIL